MQRLTGVPSSKGDCTGWVGSGCVVIWKAPPFCDKAAPHNKIYLNFISKFVSTKFTSSKNYTWTREPRGARRMQPSIGKGGSLWGSWSFNRVNVRRPHPGSSTRSHGRGLSWTSNLIKTALHSGACDYANAGIDMPIFPKHSIEKNVAQDFKSGFWKSQLILTQKTAIYWHYLTLCNYLNCDFIPKFGTNIAYKYWSHHSD